MKRQELRYILQLSLLKQFLKQLKKYSKETFYKPYNWTIYFNNNEYELPFGVSIKARKYSNTAFCGNLDLNEKWIFEIKQDKKKNNYRYREKKRKNMQLKSIVKKVAKIKYIYPNKISLPLKPFLLDSYKRRHFVLDKGLRITIDTNLNYFLLNDDLSSIFLGKENYARIEVKIQSCKNKPVLSKILDLLNSLNAEPTISKKDFSCSLLSKYLRKKHALETPLSNIEIEAKLSLSKSNQNVFHKIKKDFVCGNIKDFTLLESFPYTLQSGKIHKYFFLSEPKIFRISLSGTSKTFCKKEDLKIVKDPFNLNCILKRKEIKHSKQHFLIKQNKVDNPIKILYRKRKYFLVENQKNKQNYCILIDRCTNNATELFQIEIEGLLSRPNVKSEKEIVKDISYLTNYLINKYPFLKPTTLTKAEWLKKQKNQTI